MERSDQLDEAGKMIDDICEKYHIALVACVDEETGEQFIAYALGEDVLEQNLSA